VEQGSVLGTIRRGCPALVDSFSWTVPKVLLCALAVNMPLSALADVLLGCELRELVEKKPVLVREVV
jgi:hypothetical protein